MILDGKVKLINENWYSDVADNEKDRPVIYADGDTVLDNIGIMAATLSYFKQDAKKSHPKFTDHQAEVYANMMYNRGKEGARRYYEKNGLGKYDFNSHALGGPLVDAARNYYEEGGPKGKLSKLLSDAINRLNAFPKNEDTFPQQIDLLHYIAKSNQQRRKLEETDPFGNNFEYAGNKDNGRLPEVTIKPDNPGHAIYLHYPNFEGAFSNAVKIGGLDLGAAVGAVYKKVTGKETLPVGHAAAVLVDPNNNATYYEYGRYPGKGFGHVRPSVKGGNWQRLELPPIKEGENDSAYIARIQDLLPDTKTGAYQAMTIPSVNVQKATEWIYEQANDSTRDEYGPGNTCANGAYNAIFPFREVIYDNPHNMGNETGYSKGAENWSMVPYSTGDIARDARRGAKEIYIMNNNN